MHNRDFHSPVSVYRYKAALLENKYTYRNPPKLIYAKRDGALATSLLSLSFFIGTGDFIGFENFAASS